MVEKAEYEVLFSPTRDPPCNFLRHQRSAAHKANVFNSVTVGTPGDSSVSP